MNLQILFLPFLSLFSLFPMIQRLAMQSDAGPRRCAWILWQLASAIRSHRGCLISGPQKSLQRSFLLPQYVMKCISEQPHRHTPVCTKAGMYTE